MGRVFLMCSGARSRYFNSKGRMCSRSSRSVRGRPASSRATLSPASASRLHAQPPDAPEPTTSTSNFDFDWKAGVSDGLATCGHHLPPLSNRNRSEEHTSELQSRLHLVCRLLLEKKKNKSLTNTTTNAA